MTVVLPELCTRRCKITIDHTLIDEAGNYVLPLGGSGDTFGHRNRLADEIFSLCQADFGDFCAALAADGTGRLPVKIASVVPGSKTSAIRIAVDLSVSADVDVWLFYQSNAGTLTQPARDAAYGSEAVWGANAQGVYLFENVGGTLDCTDETGYHRDGTNSGATVTAGPIGGAASADGNDAITFSDSLIASTAVWRMSIWAKEHAWWVNWPAWSFPNAGFLFYPNDYFEGNGIRDSGGFGFNENDATRNPALWHLFEVVSYSATIHAGLVDGVVVQTSTLNYTLPSNPGCRLLHNWPNGTQWFVGQIAQCLCADNAPSTAYLLTDYTLQTSASLVTVGTPEDTEAPTFLPAWIAGRQHLAIGGGII